MLAMADRNGRVWASIPGLAKEAGVPLEDAERALKDFLSPDEYSRTKDHEGRRIKEIDGGWLLLNHAKYRDMRDEAERKAYKAEWIRKKRAKERRQPVDNVDKCRPQSTQAEADTDTEKERGASRHPPVDFAVPETSLKWAKVEGFTDYEIHDQTSRFRDHEFPRPLKDWNRAWRNWMRKAKDFRDPACNMTTSTEAERLGLVRMAGETDERWEKRISDALVKERYG